ncbi:hypothetical protein J3F83DRAFT_726434 [Trichoderma novae-zelandiae]
MPRTKGQKASIRNLLLRRPMTERWPGPKKSCLPPATSLVCSQTSAYLTTSALGTTQATSRTSKLGDAHRATATVAQETCRWTTSADILPCKASSQTERRVLDTAWHRARRQAVTRCQKPGSHVIRSTLIGGAQTSPTCLSVCLSATSECPQKRLRCCVMSAAHPVSCATKLPEQLSRMAQTWGGGSPSHAALPLDLRICI